MRWKLPDTKPFKKPLIYPSSEINFPFLKYVSDYTFHPFYICMYIFKPWKPGIELQFRSFFNTILQVSVEWGYL